VFIEKKAISKRYSPVENGCFIEFGWRFNLDEPGAAVCRRQSWEAA